MIDQSPDPSFERTFTSERSDLLEDFQKTVIQDQERFILVFCVFHAHRHHCMEMALVQEFLTLAIIPHATLYEFRFCQNNNPVRNSTRL